jgi:hypothetical protein
VALYDPNFAAETQKKERISEEARGEIKNPRPEGPLKPYGPGKELRFKSGLSEIDLMSIELGIDSNTNRPLLGEVRMEPKLPIDPLEGKIALVLRAKLV